MPPYGKFQESRWPQNSAAATAANDTKADTRLGTMTAAPKTSASTVAQSCSI